MIFLTRKWFHLLIVAFWSGWVMTGEASPVQYRILDHNGVLGNSSAVTSGIEVFHQSVRRHCGFSIPYQITQKSIPTQYQDFNFDSTWVPQTIQGQPVFFRFFQWSLFRFNLDHQIQRKSGEVLLHVTYNLSHHCGFAFPRVQFFDSVTLSKNKSVAWKKYVVPNLVHQLILTSPQSNTLDCGNYPRVVAHELAHLFIQDDPPHQCREDDGTLRTCLEPNLLAVLREAAPSRPPGMRPPGRGPIDWDPGQGEDILLPANGTYLNPHQCEQIKNTLMNFER